MSTGRSWPLWKRRAGCAASVVLAAACACAPQESPTRGQLVVCAAESHAALASREATLFTSLYPDARVRVGAAPTQAAFAALLGDGAQMVISDRPPNAVEQEVLAARHLEITQVRVGEDALGLFVHPANA